MPPTTNIVLLFEDGDVREDALAYALGLARRLRAGLRVLMLSSTAPGDAEIAGFHAAMARFRPADLEFQSDIRSGDKASELLKFLATTPAVASIVWGGSDESVPKRPGDRRGRHWFAKMSAELQCPIVASKAREK